MVRCEFKPQGVCSTKIEFDLDGNVVRNISFTRGCNGNLKALSRAVDGKTVEEIESLFRGLTCGEKSTSCSDQLARAVREKYEESKGQ
ncbi:MAG: TIGR03905 family TSCPD domain-containing protein [Oscillospiraceae bacterium]|nr:TIGR03905 family TSCPD domain-containing protein [Oscillospiraceae bacterium]MCI9362974.1 TIGR03905 family TSCPD domain-containing protein [Oscillospiraceae bacterium]MCI9669714.1 TIGR03905 family TSCPD domain-containing protein [Oscillospiraceae bacterium]RKJ55313.1 TIGR03905 family TSCPD domain-containing protein [bacterium 1XD42-8]RKJ66433.1 TIGR03905 family TSCPD domain-containing protein [bacterium 1XD42-1]